MSEQKKEEKRRGAFLPLFVSALLVCGLGYCVWHYLDLRSRMFEAAQAESLELTRLAGERDDLARLLKLPPCETKKHWNLQDTRPDAAIGAGQPKSAANTAGASHAAASSAKGLVDNVERACVFVVAGDGRNGLSTGSGFFVTPQYIVTNSHVVGKNAQKVLVTSKSLGKPALAQVVASSSGGGSDFALLKVDLPSGSRNLALPLKTEVSKTEKIGAWGFPAVIGKSDPAYMRLLAGGDISAVPELAYTEGVVSAVLNRVPNMIVHTAPISPGSSGGPLLNEAGEVVGINTMISLDEGSYRQASIALTAEDLLGFLKSQGVTP